MKAETDTPSEGVEIKVVGKSGQISLGKRYAGKSAWAAFRDGDFLRFISLHPDHDSAYQR